MVQSNINGNNEFILGKKNPKNISDFYQYAKNEDPASKKFLCDHVYFKDLQLLYVHGSVCCSGCGPIDYIISLIFGDTRNAEKDTAGEHALSLLGKER